MLALSTGALTASCALLFGMPFLVPTFRAEGLRLSGAGALAAAPSLGLVLTLVLWGAFADRYGEHLAMWLGLALTAGGGALAAVSTSTVGRGAALALAGAAGASVNSASGRLVMGWFGVSQRGLAMGVRQMGQPLGVAVAALLVPPLAAAGGARLALLVLAALSGAFALVVGVGASDPPGRLAGLARRMDTSGPATSSTSPYRAGWTLPRIHASSALLVVPQFATATFSAIYLVSERGWSTLDAGRVLAVVALVGALGRLVAGRWSDHAGSRLGPMRQIAVASLLAMLAVALTVRLHSPLVLVALGAASVISVADNGLGFTATAEVAGTAWSGRALGLQNTGQNLAAFATGALVGALAAAYGYATAFALCALAPLVGAAMIPVSAERRFRAAAEGSRCSDPAPPIRRG